MNAFMKTIKFFCVPAMLLSLSCYSPLPYNETINDPGRVDKQPRLTAVKGHKNLALDLFRFESRRNYESYLDRYFGEEDQRVYNDLAIENKEIIGTLSTRSTDVKEKYILLRENELNQVRPIYDTIDACVYQADSLAGQFAKGEMYLIDSFINTYKDCLKINGKQVPVQVISSGVEKNQMPINSHLNLPSEPMPINPSISPINQKIVTDSNPKTNSKGFESYRTKAREHEKHNHK